MNRTKMTVAAALTLLTTPQLVAAQADWKFEIPLAISNLTTNVTRGALMCVVGQTAGWIGEEVSSRVHTLQSGETYAQPGEAPPNWDGIDLTSGIFVGYNTFAIDASGNAPPSVEVEVVAPAAASEDLKISARYWGCALALNIGAGWYSVHPDLAPPDFPQSTLAVDGSTFQGWFAGTIN